MVLSNQISNYISNSKIKGQLCRWQQPFVNVFITPITANVSNKDFLYFQVEKAYQTWNLYLKQNNINVIFQKTNIPQNADITVHWVKVDVYMKVCVSI